MPKESSVGYQRVPLTAHLSGGALSGTGAINIINAMTPGFRFWLEAVVARTVDTLVGAGGTQTFKVRKGAVDGTVIATITVTLASHATLGTVQKVSVTAADQDNAHFGADTDTISVTRDAGGTAFSAGAVDLDLILRQREQARV